MTDGLEGFLQSSSEAGKADSEGTFTVNFAAARAKMAKFQLADPHYFILKLVQAGVLASRGMDISFAGNGWEIVYQDWQPELTLEKIREKLSSGLVTACEEPLDHLTIALNTLMTLAPSGIRLAQKIEGSHENRFLELNEEMEIKSQEGDWKESKLTLLIPKTPHIDRERIEELILERCGFAPIPLTLNEETVLPRLRATSGAHRDIFFRHNKELAQGQTLGSRNALDQKSENIPEDEFSSFLRLTVDLDPYAQVWLCKAGVMLENKAFDLGVPGLTGVVEADHLDTDLTGVQFIANEKVDQLSLWLKGPSKIVLDRAIKVTDTVDAEAAPVALNGWLNGWDVTTGCGLGCLGGIGGFWLFIDNLISGGVLSAIVSLGVLFPGAYVGAKIHKKGCEKTPGSEEEAQRTLRNRLLAARDSLT